MRVGYGITGTRILSVGPGVSVGGGGGGAPSLDADAQVLIDAMSVTPDSARQALINDTIVALKNAGIWDKLDALWMMTAHDEQAALLNWKNPGMYDLTHDGGMQFSTDVGMRNAGGSHLDTGFIPSEHGVNYQLNDAGLAVQTPTDVAENAEDMGARTDGSVNVAYIISRWSDDRAFLRINQDAPAERPVSTDSSGLWVSQRTTPSAAALYRNGTQMAASAAESTGLPTVAFAIAAGRSGESITNRSSRRYTYARIGASLTEQQLDDEYQIVTNYLAAIGATNPPDYFDGPYNLLLLDRSDGLGTGNSQGVAYDGTHYYYSDSYTIYKYTRDDETGTYTLVTSRDVSGDDPTGKTQINGMHYHNSYLWVSANNFSQEPRKGWIIQYDPSDLSWIATHETEAHWSESGAWHDVGDGDEIWVVYHDWDHVSRYDSSFNHIGDYLMPLVEGQTNVLGQGGLYQGAAWHGDVLITQIHNSNPLTEMHFHRWTGDGFEAVQRIPMEVGWFGTGQGIHWETPGEVLLLTERGSGNRIVRAGFTDDS